MQHARDIGALEIAADDAPQAAKALGPTRDEFIEKTLAELEAVWRDAGALPAVHDAVLFCQMNQLTLPEWAAVAVINQLITAYWTAGDGGPGAFSSPRGRFVKDLAHFRRWQALTAGLKMVGLDGMPKVRRGRPRAGERDSYARALSYAAELLDREPTGAGKALEREIEASFKRVDASRAAGEERFSFDKLLTL